MQSKFKHLIDLNDYSLEEINTLITLGHEITHHKKRYKDACPRRILGTLFYEPSTRTQMSFQSAMLRLGGNIIGFDNPMTSSVSKGENIKDTTKIVSNYADVLVIRHPLEGAAKAAAFTADSPVINAGDGGHLHPTQTLTDLLTLREEKGTLSGLKIGVCGDLKNGRTVHSLISALNLFDGNKIYLISSDKLGLPEYLAEKTHGVIASNSLEEVIGELDVLYMTRIQRERFGTQQEFLQETGKFILTKKLMENASKELAVLHPLPRDGEIEIAVDDDSRALYFKQARYGMFIRMALIMTLIEESKTLGKNQKGFEISTGKAKARKCKNINCITNTEEYLPRYFREDGACSYCDCK